MKPEERFGKLRNLIFPIYKHELRKFLPLCFINFGLTFSYSALRVLKDAFVISKGGAEAISYLKAYGVTPVVIFFTICYTFITKVFKRDGRFNTIIIYLLTFIIFFKLVLIPNSQYIKANFFYNKMMKKIPHLQGLWSIIRDWHISLFYIHAELWGAYAANIAFWTLANDVTTVGQSKRFYGFFPLAGNVGSMVAGFFVTYIFSGNFDNILTTIIILTILSIVVYNLFFNKYMIFSKEIREATRKVKKIQTRKKIKLSFKKSLSFLLKSKYLLLIATLVLGYNMSTSLLEALIKSSWADYAQGNKAIISKLGGTQIMFSGILSILFAFPSTYLQRKNWLYGALFTPIIFISFTFLFFTFSLLVDISKNIGFYAQYLDIFYIVALGWLNITIIKASKYSFFEPTKEATYIPLEEELKIKGKAAVDGIGGRLGKGLSSILLTLIVIPLGYGKIANIKYTLFIIIALIIVIWIVAVFKLKIAYNFRLKKIQAKGDFEAN